MTLFSGALSYRWLLPIFVLAVAAVTGGCAGGAPVSTAPNPQVTPETRQSIATAIALKAAQGASGQATPVVASGPRTVADISATAPTSGLLDNKHLSAGKGCDVCHGPIAEGAKPADVTPTKCLSCHGGSYDAVAAKTSNLGARNPHKAHTGRQDCDRCHHVHVPFEFSCNSCHSFPIPARYQATGTKLPATDPATGEARRVETED